MANQLAVDLLMGKITGLDIVRQELTDLYARTADLDLSDDIREKITSINETLFFMRSEQLAMASSTVAVNPPTMAEIEQVKKILNQLDAYVRTDQNFHMAVNYLTQIADQLKTASEIV